MYTLLIHLVTLAAAAADAAVVVVVLSNVNNVDIFLIIVVVVVVAVVIVVGLKSRCFFHLSTLRTNRVYITVGPVAQQRIPSMRQSRKMSAHGNNNTTDKDRPSQFEDIN